MKPKRKNDEPELFFNVRLFAYYMNRDMPTAEEAGRRLRMEKPKRMPMRDEGW